MPRSLQLALVTGALFAATGNATRIRAHGDVPVTTPSTTRRLQTTTVVTKVLEPSEDLKNTHT
ncbi:unnamed protein product [Ectocarpus sp. CCAP 1310/34]|nr:unnamed protein product [Ectocarpus sp. CCAP 1310/34]